MFGMGTGVTLLLWPPGNLVPGISAYAPQRRFGGTSLRGLSTVAGVSQRRRNRPRAYRLVILRLSDLVICNFQIVKSPIHEISKLVEYSAMTSFSDHTFTIKRSE